MYSFRNILTAPGQAQTSGSHDCVAGVQALLDLLAARPNPDGAAESRQLLGYGIYSSTHLLALAYAAELSLWRYISLQAPGIHAPNIHAGTAATEESTQGDARSEAAKWRTQALTLSHRYIFVVEVLMEG